MPRIREALEANEWAMASSSGDFDELSSALLGDMGDKGLGFEVGELEQKMLGLRMVINEGGDDEEFDEGDLDAEKLEMLMMRVHAIKGEYSIHIISLSI